MQSAYNRLSMWNRSERKKRELSRNCFTLVWTSIVLSFANVLSHFDELRWSEWRQVTIRPTDRRFFDCPWMQTRHYGNWNPETASWFIRGRIFKTQVLNQDLVDRRQTDGPTRDWGTSIEKWKPRRRCRLADGSSNFAMNIQFGALSPFPTLGVYLRCCRCKQIKYV